MIMREWRGRALRNHADAYRKHFRKASCLSCRRIAASSAHTCANASWSRVTGWNSLSLPNGSRCRRLSLLRVPRSIRPSLSLPPSPLLATLTIPCGIMSSLKSRGVDPKMAMSAHPLLTRWHSILRAGEVAVAFRPSRRHHRHQQGRAAIRPILRRGFHILCQP